MSCWVHPFRWRNEVALARTWVGGWVGGCGGCRKQGVNGGQSLSHRILAHGRSLYRRIELTVRAPQFCPFRFALLVRKSSEAKRIRILRILPLPSRIGSASPRFGRVRATCAGIGPDPVGISGRRQVGGWLEVPWQRANQELPAQHLMQVMRLNLQRGVHECSHGAAGRGMPHRMRSGHRSTRAPHRV